MAATLDKSPCQEALSEEWYNRLLQEIDYRCSICDSVHTDIHHMEQAVQQAYAMTAASLKEIFEIGEIAKRWYGMAAFATAVLARARFLQQTNQICGVHLGTLLEYQKEALDRFQLHCPEFAENCRKKAKQTDSA
jgi:hypothetical protein